MESGCEELGPGLGERHAQELGLGLREGGGEQVGLGFGQRSGQQLRLNTSSQGRAKQPYLSSTSVFEQGGFYKMYSFITKLRFFDESKGKAQKNNIGVLPLLPAVRWPASPVLPA